jgi:hypothetical protein
VFLSQLIQTLILSSKSWEDGLSGNLSSWAGALLFDEKIAEVMRKPSSKLYRQTQASSKHETHGSCIVFLYCFVGKMDGL